MSIKRIIPLVLLLAVAFGIAYSANKANAPENSEQVQQEAQNQVQAINYEGVEGRTALDLLKENHNVELQSYSFGDMVVGIEGVKADSSNFWAFYVNGNMAQVGASQYVTKDGDVIEWKLEEIRF
jgi:hypothetical protein